MSGFINTIDQLGDDVVFKSILGDSITEFKDNVLTQIRRYAFHGCENLTFIDLPNLTSITRNAFSSSKLQKGYFQNTQTVEQSAFDHSEVVLLDFSNLSIIKLEAFYYTSKLATLILRSNTLCTLENSNAFSYSKIKNGTGYIYVPRALIEDYKVATNWSTYANQFRALEDYTVDGTTTGELDTTKI